MTKSNANSDSHFGGIDLEESLPSNLEDQVRAVIRDEVSQLIEVRADNVNEAGLEDIWIAGQPLGKIIESNRKRTKEATEAASSGSDPEGKDGEDGPQDDNQRDMLPIERLAEMGGDDNGIMADVTASVDRAVTIFTHFREWSKKTPKGWVVRDGLRSLLNTALEETLSWKQVYRACRKLEEWSKGAITFRKTRRHGWILVAEDGRPSSVATG